MGRCNGGGGARHGGGGYQDGQAKGTKAGKRGHGKSGQHDATASTREVQKRDKFGKPLNHGPYQNGYHVGGSKQAAQGVNVQADNVAELGALPACTTIDLDGNPGSDAPVDEALGSPERAAALARRRDEPSA